jgi:hypothetical protein
MFAKQNQELRLKGLRLRRGSQSKERGANWRSNSKGLSAEPVDNIVLQMQRHLNTALKRGNPGLFARGTSGRSSCGVHRLSKWPEKNSPVVLRAACTVERAIDGARMKFGALERNSKSDARIGQHNNRTQELFNTPQEVIRSVHRLAF